MLTFKQQSLGVALGASSTIQLDIVAVFLQHPQINVNMANPIGNASLAIEGGQTSSGPF